MIISPLQEKMESALFIIISATICFQLNSASTLSAVASNDVTNSTAADNTTQNNETITPDNDTSTATSVNTLEPEYSTTAPFLCPRFSARYENRNRNLIISYMPGVCEMVVQAKGIVNSFPALRNLFGQAIRRNERRADTDGMPDGFLEKEEVACEELPMRSMGPFVFVDTVPEQCQILLALRKNRSVPEEFRNLRGFRLGGSGRRRPRGRGRFSRSRVPVFEYLDDFIY